MYPPPRTTTATTMLFAYEDWRGGKWVYKALIVNTIDLTYFS